MMNEEIKALIEREAERLALLDHEEDSKNFDDAKTNMLLCADYALSLFKWRKFTSELPNIGQHIVCKGGKGNFHLANPLSHDGIHWLSEHFTEWMPIPN